MAWLLRDSQRPWGSRQLRCNFGITTIEKIAAAFIVDTIPYWCSAAVQYTHTLGFYVLQILRFVKPNLRFKVPKHEINFKNDAFITQVYYQLWVVTFIYIHSERFVWNSSFWWFTGSVANCDDPIFRYFHWMWMMLYSSVYNAFTVWESRVR
jgi:hypothetical protein